MPTTGFNEMNIRPEPTHHTESYTDRNTYKQNNYENKKNSYQHNHVYDNDENKEYPKTLPEIIDIK